MSVETREVLTARALPPEVPPLPAYLVDTYSWAYLHPRSLKLLDRHLVVNGILWGNYRKLVRNACGEFARGNRVLQAASVYGDLSSRLAWELGLQGFLYVIDVSPLQVEHCRRKLAGRTTSACASPMRQVRARPVTTAPAVFSCCTRSRTRTAPIVEALLASVRVGGKVVFVDHHRPAWWHPLKPVMSLVFRWLEPFAASLWSGEIQDLTPPESAIHCRKETWFGGLYQQVVLVRMR